ncbi:ComEC/Rec2 family competence protein [Candidatus Daviesbacteria bacterium]|nr:ComEC/Rec2 family competence protein [Candidatus Daviesbacteria bacterium]
MKRLPIILAIVLYLLIYFIRSQQPSWDLKLDLFSGIRSGLDQRISQLLPSPQAELLSGILLGQNKNLPGQLKLALRDTSTLHIVVASGQNLSMVAGLFLALAGLIKRKYALSLGLLAALSYTMLSGMQIPIIRAAIMFSLASIAQIYGRQRDGVWVLLVTAGLMLLINPAWISSLSFQLSVLATLGVVSVAPILLKYLKNLPIIGQDLAVTLAAQIMVTPVIVQNFHQLSLVSLATNVMVLWTIPFIMILGSIMLIFGVIAPLVNAFLTYFIYIVQFFARLPFAWEYIGEQWWVVWVGYYMVIGGILVGLNQYQKIRSTKSEIRNKAQNSNIK